MSRPPLISIITVTYNAEKVIGKTIESLKTQTFKDFEHLVIDGASKDSTVRIIESAGLHQSKILSEPDEGLYDAMNKGLGLAKGEYVLFLNAGDTFHEADTLAQYAREAEKGKDIIFGDTIIVDAEGNKIADRHLSAPSELTEKSFASGMLICHQAFMVRRELTSEYDLRYRFSADYDWCVKCIKKSRAENNVNLHNVTIDYLSEGLTDKNKWKSLRERFRIMATHYGLFPTLLNHLGFIFRAVRRGNL